MKMDVFIKRKGYNARGLFDSDSNTIIVKRGSNINPNVAPGFVDHNYAQYREDLIKEGVIMNNEFTCDYEFDSPSKASSVILGSNSNGRKYWMKEAGTSLNSILKSMFATNKDKEEGVIEDLIDLASKNNVKKIKELEMKIVERTTHNTEDTESMMNDILAYRKQIDALKEDEVSLDSVLNLVKDLWERRSF